MRTIWKIPLELKDRQSIAAPGIGRALDVQLQNGKPFLWLEVDSNEKLSYTRIYMVGTGRVRPPVTAFYIATVQCGAFVWHFYNGGAA